MTSFARSLVFIFALSVFSLSLPVAKADMEVEREFVVDVLFKSQYGKTHSRDSVVRWLVPLRVHITGGTVREFLYARSAMEFFTDNFSNAGIEMDLYEGDGPEPNVQIVFADRPDFWNVMDRFKVSADVVSGNVMPFHWLRGKGEVYYAVLLIDKSLSDLWKRYAVLAGLAEILGPKASSKRMPESLFYMERGFVEPKDQMPDIDRRLLRFLYRHLKPGDDEAAVRRAFDAHWASVTAD